MRSPALQRNQRSKGIRTAIPAKDGTGPATCLSDFTYVWTWVGFVCTAFNLDVFVEKIVPWNVACSKAVALVDVPLWIALWRDHEGHRVVRAS